MLNTSRTNSTKPNATNPVPHSPTLNPHPLTTNLQPLTTAYWPILLCLCAVLFFYGIQLNALYRTEALRALVAREMLDSGNWIVPAMYGQSLLTKPPGMYAAIAACSVPFGGVNEISARLPSAIAATGFVLLLGWYTRRQLGTLGGLISATAVPCSFLWIDKGAVAEIDMLHTALTGAAIILFLRAEETPSKPNWAWWIAAFVCVAAGALTKWTAPMFFYGMLIPYLFVRGRLRLLCSPQHLLGAAVCGAICLGWVGLVALSAGMDVLWGTVFQEAQGRISPAHHVGGNVLAETLVHPLKILLINLPWALFAVLAFLPQMTRDLDERQRRLNLAFHCWAWPNLLIWTLFPDHATRHSFPLFPGLVGLGAMVWITLVEGKLGQLTAHRLSILILAGLLMFALTVTGLGAAALAILPLSTWWILALCVGGSLWLAQSSWRAFQHRRPGQLFVLTICTWLIVKLAWMHLYIPIRTGQLDIPSVDATWAGIPIRIQVDPPRTPIQKASIVQAAVPEDETLYVFAIKYESIMYYYGRPVLRLDNWDDLPAGNDWHYCVIEESAISEYRESGWEVETLGSTTDERNVPIAVVAVRRVPLVVTR